MPGEGILIEDGHGRFVLNSEADEYPLLLKSFTNSFDIREGRWHPAFALDRKAKVVVCKASDCEPPEPMLVRAGACPFCRHIYQIPKYIHEGDKVGCAKCKTGHQLRSQPFGIIPQHALDEKPKGEKAAEPAFPFPVSVRISCCPGCSHLYKVPDFIQDGQRVNCKGCRRSHEVKSELVSLVDGQDASQYEGSNHSTEKGKYMWVTSVIVMIIAVAGLVAGILSIALFSGISQQLSFLISALAALLVSLACFGVLELFCAFQKKDFAFGIVFDLVAGLALFSLHAALFLFVYLASLSMDDKNKGVLVAANVVCAVAIAIMGWLYLQKWIPFRFRPVSPAYAKGGYASWTLLVVSIILVACLGLEFWPTFLGLADANHPQVYGALIPILLTALLTSGVCPHGSIVVFVTVLGATTPLVWQSIDTRLGERNAVGIFLMFILVAMANALQCLLVELKDPTLLWVWMRYASGVVCFVCFLYQLIAAFNGWDLELFGVVRWEGQLASAAYLVLLLYVPALLRSSGANSPAGYLPIFLGMCLAPVGGDSAFVAATLWAVGLAVLLLFILKRYLSKDIRAIFGLMLPVKELPYDHDGQNDDDADPFHRVFRKVRGFLKKTLDDRVELTAAKALLLAWNIQSHRCLWLSEGSGVWDRMFVVIVLVPAVCISLWLLVRNLVLTPSLAKAEGRIALWMFVLNCSVGFSGFMANWPQQIRTDFQPFILTSFILLAICNVLYGRWFYHGSARRLPGLALISMFSFYAVMSIHIVVDGAVYTNGNFEYHEWAVIGCALGSYLLSLLWDIRPRPVQPPNLFEDLDDERNNEPQAIAYTVHHHHEEGGEIPGNAVGDAENAENHADAPVAASSIPVATIRISFWGTMFCLAVVALSTNFELRVLHGRRTGELAWVVPVVLGLVVILIEGLVGGCLRWPESRSTQWVTLQCVAAFWVCGFSILATENTRGYLTFGIFWVLMCYVMFLDVKTRLRPHPIRRLTSALATDEIELGTGGGQAATSSMSAQSNAGAGGGGGVGGAETSAISAMSAISAISGERDEEEEEEEAAVDGMVDRAESSRSASRSSVTSRRSSVSGFLIRKGELRKMINSLTRDEVRFYYLCWLALKYLVISETWCLTDQCHGEGVGIYPFAIGLLIWGLYYPLIAVPLTWCGAGRAMEDFWKGPNSLVQPGWWLKQTRFVATFVGVWMLADPTAGVVPVVAVLTLLAAHLIVAGFHERLILFPIMFLHALWTFFVLQQRRGLWIAPWINDSILASFSSAALGCSALALFLFFTAGGALAGWHDNEGLWIKGCFWGREHHVSDRTRGMSLNALLFISLVFSFFAYPHLWSLCLLLLVYWRFLMARFVFVFAAVPMVFCVVAAGGLVPELESWGVLHSSQSWDTSVIVCAIALIILGVFQFIVSAYFEEKYPGFWGHQSFTEPGAAQKKLDSEYRRGKARDSAPPPDALSGPEHQSLANSRSHKEEEAHQTDDVVEEQRGAEETDMASVSVSGSTHTPAAAVLTSSPPDDKPADVDDDNVTSPRDGATHEASEADEGAEKAALETGGGHDQVDGNDHDHEAKATSHDADKDHDDHQDKADAKTGHADDKDDDRYKLKSAQSIFDRAGLSERSPLAHLPTFLTRVADWIALLYCCVGAWLLTGATLGYLPLIFFFILIVIAIVTKVNAVSASVLPLLIFQSLLTLLELHRHQAGEDQPWGIFLVEGLNSNFAESLGVAAIVGSLVALVMFFFSGGQMWRWADLPSRFPVPDILQNRRIGPHEVVGPPFFADLFLVEAVVLAILTPFVSKGIFLLLLLPPLYARALIRRWVSMWLVLPGLMAAAVLLCMWALKVRLPMVFNVAPALLLLLPLLNHVLLLPVIRRVWGKNFWFGVPNTKPDPDAQDCELVPAKSFWEEYGFNSRHVRSRSIVVGAILCLVGAVIFSYGTVLCTDETCTDKERVMTDRRHVFPWVACVWGFFFYIVGLSIYTKNGHDSANGSRRYFGMTLNLICVLISVFQLPDMAVVCILSSGGLLIMVIVHIVTLGFCTVPRDMVKFRLDKKVREVKKKQKQGLPLTKEECCLVGAKRSKPVAIELDGTKAPK